MAAAAASRPHRRTARAWRRHRVERLTVGAQLPAVIDVHHLFFVFCFLFFGGLFFYVLDIFVFGFYALLIISVPGGLLFLSPAPKGGYPLRLTFCQYLHEQLVRKMTSFRPSLFRSLFLSLSLSRRHRKHVAARRMLHAYDASERERKRAREREGPKLVIFLTRCLCKSGQNVSRKGYPPSGAGDRNNNSPRDRNNNKLFVHLNILLFNSIFIIIIVIFIIISMILWILHFSYLYTTDTWFIRTQRFLSFLFLFISFIVYFCSIWGFFYT